ncbi:MAG: hypothetical protein AAF849_19260 [Bacteroidota bacterium]
MGKSSFNFTSSASLLHWILMFFAWHLPARLTCAGLLAICFVFSFFSTAAQVSNVRAKLNNTQNQFKITYDLKKSTTDFWDVRLIAFIDEIRVDPSRTALSGAQGIAVKGGKSKHVFWDAYVDVEQIDGWVRFEVQANVTPFELPKPLPTDLIVGNGMAALGLGLLASGLPNLLKQEKINLNTTPQDDPIVYYQTFCDADSPHFDATQVIPTQVDQPSACDGYFEEAAQVYQAAALRAWAGGGFMILGGIILLSKPFYNKIQIPSYLIDNGLSLSPVLQFSTNEPFALGHMTTRLRLSYSF